MLCSCLSWVHRFIFQGKAHPVSRLAVRSPYFTQRKLSSPPNVICLCCILMEGTINPTCNTHPQAFSFLSLLLFPGDAKQWFFEKKSHYFSVLSSLKLKYFSAKIWHPTSVTHTQSSLFWCCPAFFFCGQDGKMLLEQHAREWSHQHFSCSTELNECLGIQGLPKHMWISIILFLQLLALWQI